MAEYTPATPQVRAAYVRAMRNAFIASAAEHEAEFDRWLTGVKTEVLEEEFQFTDDQWRAYQALPEQGYSHRAHLQWVFNAWLRNRAAKYRAERSPE